MLSYDLRVNLSRDNPLFVWGFFSFINLLNSELWHRCYRWSRDVPSACLRLSTGVQKTLSQQPPSQENSTWLGPSHHPSRSSNGTATPGKAGFFKRLQLPRKLRAFKVSSPHLAAYMGTGGCWTLRIRLSCETSLQAFYITADSVGVNFYVLSK